MVEIRVAVSDAAPVDGLLQRLAELFDRSSVSLDQSRNEVKVRSEWESRSVVAVLLVVESWLAADGVDSATLSVGDRSYTMTGATCDPQDERAAAASVVRRTNGSRPNIPFVVAHPGRHDFRPSSNRRNRWSP